MADQPHVVNTSDILSGEQIGFGMTEHVVVFEVLHGASRWWAWCFVDLGGAGFSRVRWSRPGGPIEEPPDGLALASLRSAPRVVFDYDTPVVTD